MNKELNIGDYVRTKEGNIFKIISGNTDNWEVDISCIKLEQTEENWYESNRYNDNGYWFNEENIIKSSPNIIDLIEEGDLVKIEYYSLRYEERVTRLFEVYYKDNKFMNLGNTKCEFMLVDGDFNDKDKKLEPIIKSIVTKKQFERMEYKIGDKD